MIFRLCVSNTKQKFRSQEKLTDKQKAASLPSSFKLPAQNDESYSIGIMSAAGLVTIFVSILNMEVSVSPQGRFFFSTWTPGIMPYIFKKMFEFTQCCLYVQCLQNHLLEKCVVFLFSFLVHISELTYLLLTALLPEVSVANSISGRGRAS